MVWTSKSDHSSMHSDVSKNDCASVVERSLSSSLRQEFLQCADGSLCFCMRRDESKHTTGSYFY